MLHGFSARFLGLPAVTGGYLQQGCDINRVRLKNFSQATATIDSAPALY
jgi:hypothetical protein